MKVLIIDKDKLSSNMVRAKLEKLGHEVYEESVKNDALDHISKETFGAVLLDPSPLTNSRPLVQSIRRSMNGYPYVILLREEASKVDFARCGANDDQEKPVDPEILGAKLNNAEALLSIFQKYGDDSEDFPSAGGVIAKSAFNQLFLSAIERADRYGEKSYLLLITVDNYARLMQTGGAYAADYAVAKLSQHLVRIRRQSDIIGQTGKNQYTLLLQRPQYETEPMDAANRFAEAFSKIDDLVQGPGIAANLQIQLIELPTGAKLVEHVLQLGG